MGGYGSGSHLVRLFKKRTTSCCLPISISSLLADGLLVSGKKKEGYLGWEFGERRRRNALHCIVDATSMTKPILQVRYGFKSKRRKGCDFDYKIKLTTTRLFRGGIRWWFLCPNMDIMDRPCRNRVAKLFMPPSSRYFGCRRCHQLTYESCQNSRRYSRWFRAVERTSGVEGLAGLKGFIRMTNNANSDWLYD